MNKAFVYLACFSALSLFVIACGSGSGNETGAEAGSETSVQTPIPCNNDDDCTSDVFYTEPCQTGECVKGYCAPKAREEGATIGEG